jgi:cytochrome d ubiquinol oxidase subunit I
MDTLLLSRIQFAANISFHILFPPSPSRCAGCCCSSGPGHVPPGTPGGAGWEQAYYFWTKVFALSFALGVVSASP